mmetsp:Transcript_46741/g.123537  ORF Transcript_46741/g.123537 Transcript_46741/m.123537 type:complete len:684 (+) Transcript_46741:21-2072(+)
MPRKEDLKLPAARAASPAPAAKSHKSTLRDTEPWPTLTLSKSAPVLHAHDPSQPAPIWPAEGEDLRKALTDHVTRLKGRQPAKILAGLSRTTSDFNVQHRRLHSKVEAQMAAHSPSDTSPSRRSTMPQFVDVSRVDFETETKELQNMFQSAWVMIRDGPDVQGGKTQKNPRKETEDHYEDPEEVRRKRRLRYFKMARKIEPPAPPLPPLKDIPHHARPKLDIVHRQCSPGYLSSFKREVVMAHMCEAMSMREAHRQQVKDKKKELVLTRKMSKIQQIQAAMEHVREVKKQRLLENELQKQQGRLFVKGMSNADGYWLVVLALIRSIDAYQIKLEEGRSTQASKEVLRAAKMKLTHAADRAVRMNRMLGGHLTKETQPAEDMFPHLQGLDKSRIIRMLQFRVKLLHILRSRKKIVSVILRCLDCWQAKGVFFVSCRRTAARVRLIQRFWRRKRILLHRVVEQVDHMWAKEEFSMCRRSLGDSNTGKDAPVEMGRGKRIARRGAMPDAHAGLVNTLLTKDTGLTKDERASAIMYPGVQRRRFIENELRRRRFLLLPAVELWQSDMAEYRVEMQKYREQRETCAVMGMEFNLPLPSIPPQPSQIPNTEELHEMIARARRTDVAMHMAGEEYEPMPVAAAKPSKEQVGHAILTEWMGGDKDLHIGKIRKRSTEDGQYSEVGHGFTDF